MLAAINCVMQKWGCTLESLATVSCGQSACQATVLKNSRQSSIRGNVCCCGQCIFMLATDLFMHLQAYLKLLLQAIGSKSKAPKSTTEARVAARCMCGMLSSLHHFNYAPDLLQAVVPLMVSKDAHLRQLSCEAIKEVLMNDEEGKVAVEAVQLVGASPFDQSVFMYKPHSAALKSFAVAYKSCSSYCVAALHKL